MTTYQLGEFVVMPDVYRVLILGRNDDGAVETRQCHVSTDHHLKWQ
ncbi:MAG: hypothetical protein AAF573_20370 [Bacteroidota bacterium]